MSVVAMDLDTAVSDAAAHLYVWALKDIPQDLRDALADAAARETHPTGKRVLDDCFQICDDSAHTLDFSAAALPARLPKTQHSSNELPIMRLRPCVPPAISPHA